MMKIYVYSLLSALSVVEMKPLDINGRVGNNVTFKCSNWNSWTDVKYQDKYFCNSSCSEKDIIRAASGKTEQKDRIEITNSAEGLYVTFTNLQKSDSKTYYCGANRIGPDSFIGVNLKVTDAESTSPRTTLKMLAVTNSSDFISDTSTSYIIYSTPLDSTTTTAASSSQGARNVLYLITCVSIIITTLMALLTLVWKMTRKQQKKEERVDAEDIRRAGQSLNQPAAVSTLGYSADSDGLYANYAEDIRRAGQSLNQPAAVSTLGYSADSDGLYANYTEIAAESVNNYSEHVPLHPVSSVVYSVIELPKQPTEHTEHSEPNQSEYSESDTLYSLAQLPKTS